jgi:hypothetical protein
MAEKWAVLMEALMVEKRVFVKAAKMAVMKVDGMVATSESKKAAT